MRRLGLIAGNGKFPLIFAEEARRQDVSVVAVAHRGETSKDIEKLVDALGIEPRTSSHEEMRCSQR